MSASGWGCCTCTARPPCVHPSSGPRLALRRAPPPTPPHPHPHTLHPPHTRQVLVATSTLAWGVNTPAHLVIIKGTEFYDAPTK